LEINKFNATVREPNLYFGFQRMEVHQRHELECALKEFGDGEEAEKKLFEEKILQLRNMNN
jgi:hypothetical protein